MVFSLSFRGQSFKEQKKCCFSAIIKGMIQLLTFKHRTIIMFIRIYQMFHIRKTKSIIMKRNVLFFAGLIALLSLFSCSKDDDPENAFKFDGQEYLINDVYLLEEVFNDGTNSEMHVFQFVFGNISGNDTTTFALAVYDEETNTLGGNYPSLGFTDDEQRMINPFALFFLSGISVDGGDTFYLTGEGGSVDVEIDNNGIYSLTFNDISVGEYESIGENENYNEIGTVSGSYEGIIHKEVEEVGIAKGNVMHERLNKLLKKVN